MPYYPKSNFKLIGFQKTKTNDKMYDAVLLNPHLKKVVLVPFGSKNYENYHDLTNLNLYPHLIHGDKKRRKAYRARAKHNIKNNYYSPSYFSYFYLW